MVAGKGKMLRRTKRGRVEVSVKKKVGVEEGEGEEEGEGMGIRVVKVRLMHLNWLTGIMRGGTSCDVRR